MNIEKALKLLNEYKEKIENQFYDSDDTYQFFYDLMSYKEIVYYSIYEINNNDIAKAAAIFISNNNWVYTQYQLENHEHESYSELFYDFYFSNSDECTNALASEFLFYVTDNYLKDILLDAVKEVENCEWSKNHE